MSDPTVKPRARGLGIPLQGRTGKHNAITDVQGVAVGHETIIAGEGKLEVGRGPIRTGVTAILPRADHGDPVFAAWSCLNGNGEMTGTAWVDESGFLSGPIMITNTHSVGAVHQAVIDWSQRSSDLKAGNPWSLPVVAETYDGFLNDINGFHVRFEHAFKALESASGGPVEEGNVGGGTGMICHKFKGGIGTSSRSIRLAGSDYLVGALVQANYGLREQLTIVGVPVGLEIPDLMPVENGLSQRDELGSIIVVIATDAPLLPHQLHRLAKRAPLGIARVGGIGGNGSGDIFVSFSTANPHALSDSEVREVRMLPNELMNELFQATIQAVEESILNALVAASTMTGIDGNTVYAIPHERLRDVLRKYNRLS